MSAIRIVALSLVAAAALASQPAPTTGPRYSEPMQLEANRPAMLRVAGVPCGTRVSVRVASFVDEKGKVVRVELLEPSEHEALNRAAIDYALARHYWPKIAEWQAVPYVWASDVEVGEGSCAARPPPGNRLPGPTTGAFGNLVPCVSNTAQPDPGAPGLSPVPLPCAATEEQPSE